MDTAIIRKIAMDCFRRSSINYPQSEILSIAHDNDRSLFVDKKWYSPLIDTIEDDLRSRGTDCVSVARIISRKKGPAAYGRVYSPDGAFARSLVGKRIKAAIGGKKYPYSKMEESVWERILESVRPKKVFGIQPSRELCVVCKRKGIWVADVQHGIIGEAHPWYGERFRSSDPAAQIPDAFLCWDFTSAEVIDTWASKKGSKAIAIGNRWLSRFLEPDPGDSLVQKLRREFQERDTNSQSKPAILIALSWSEANIPNGFMVDGLRDAIRATSEKYHWYVRLHPNQVGGFATHEGRKFSSFYNEHLLGHADWEIATYTALPLLLSHCDLVISWNSSVSIEAAQMGMKSAQLEPRFRSGEFVSDNYTAYRKEGFIDLVEESADSIQRWIAESLGFRRPPGSLHQYDANYERILDFLSSTTEP